MRTKPTPNPATKLADLVFVGVPSSSMLPPATFRAQAGYPNGYGASVLATKDDNGNFVPFELAVLRDGRVTCDTPVTNDVLRFGTVAFLETRLAQIAALPPRAERPRSKRRPKAAVPA